MNLDNFAKLLEWCIGHGETFDFLYHPDADPGNGAGFSVAVGDLHKYGDLDEACRAHLDRIERQELPHA